MASSNDTTEKRKTDKPLKKKEKLKAAEDFTGLSSY